MMTRPAAWMLTIGLVGLVASEAWAQAPQTAIEAEQLFREGKRLMDAGDYARACEAFDGSLRKDPAVSTRLNLGHCREKNQQYASAWGHFVEAAREARNNPGQADLLKVADERAAQLELRLSYLIINVADEARVLGLEITRNGEPVDPATWNRDIPVDGGTYVVAGKAPAYEPWSTTVTVHASKDKQSVNVPRFASAAAGARDGTDAGDDASDDARDAPRPRGPLTRKRKLAIGAWAFGAVALGSGLALEVSSRGIYDEAKASQDNVERRELTAQANRGRTFATVAAGVGVAAIATGIYLWLDGKPRPSRDVTLVPHITTDGTAAVVLIGSF